MRKLNYVLITLVLAVLFLAIEVVIVKSASKYEPEVSVVFANVRIPAKTEINKDMLRERKVSLSLAHRQSVKSMNALIGKKAKTDIEEGEMILTGKIGIVDEMQEIDVKDRNNRLFTVEFRGDQANGWWLLVGQYVDIIFVPNDKAKPQAGAQADPQAAAVKRLRNVRIAALIDDKGKLLENSGRNSIPKYISFELSDEQDEFLAYAKSNGRLEVSALPEKKAN